MFSSAAAVQGPQPGTYGASSSSPAVAAISPPQAADSLQQHQDEAMSKLQVRVADLPRFLEEHVHAHVVCHPAVVAASPATSLRQLSRKHIRGLTTIVQYEDNGVKMIPAAGAPLHYRVYLLRFLES